MRILKYELPTTPQQTSVMVEMPVDSTPLHVELQGTRLFIWAAVKDESTVHDCEFLMFATGETINEWESIIYIGTAVLEPLGLVWHVYHKCP